MPAAWTEKNYSCAKVQSRIEQAWNWETKADQQEAETQKRRRAGIRDLKRTQEERDIFILSAKFIKQS